MVSACLGHDLDISSGYRCPELNSAVGGSPTSQHCMGLAADFTCEDFGSPLEIAQALGAWFFDRTDAATVLVDACTALNCNPTCPAHADADAGASAHFTAVLA